MEQNMEANTLALLRHYLASHAAFNGLSALQLNLLAHQREDGLMVLRHFSGMLRGLAAVTADKLSDWSSESLLLHAWVGLENIRSAGHNAMEVNAIPTSGKLPAFLLLPFAETQWLRLLKTRAAGKMEIAARVHEDEITIELKANESMPETGSFEKSHEQEQRFQLYALRLELFQQLGYTTNIKETDCSGSLHIQPNKHNHESSNY